MLSIMTKGSHKAVNMLEIGAHGGKSINVWTKYFTNSNAKVATSSS